MKEFFTFEELNAMKAMESELPMNESLEDIKILANKSKAALKAAIKAKLNKLSPGLLSDEKFIEQLVASFAYTTE